MTRCCDICGSVNSDLIYKQYLYLPDINKKVSYDIVCCNLCGFIYVNNIEKQINVDDYYSNNFKYTQNIHQDKPLKQTLHAHDQYFKFINAFLIQNGTVLKNQYRILDVGCASGHLLSIFKNNGYKHLDGIDPLLYNRKIARKNYGINVIPADFLSFENHHIYDVILFSAVLEHMINLNEVIKKLYSLLKPKGIVFIAVPDAEKFGKILYEPFMEFSLEHINYFTGYSLQNLMSTAPFKKLKSASVIFKSNGDYASLSIWIKDTIKQPILYDKVGKKALKKYIMLSAIKMKTINEIIDSLISNKTLVSIWGAGSLTSRLMATTHMKKLNIKLLIDSNPGLIGKKLAGSIIEHPDKLSDTNNTIIISSFISVRPIRQLLINKYKYEGKIITFN